MPTTSADCRLKIEVQEKKKKGIITKLNITTTSPAHRQNHDAAVRVAIGLLIMSPEPRTTIDSLDSSASMARSTFRLSAPTAAQNSTIPNDSLRPGL